MMIPHIELPSAVANRNQMAADNLATTEFGGDNVVRLVVIKNRIAADLAGSRIRNGPKAFIVVINIAHLLAFNSNQDEQDRQDGKRSIYLVNPAHPVQIPS